ncbi:MAG: type II toxin-antitoxin system RatA family toxin [Alphaproteobacteria bacterium]|nr:type II toxin-antitoxin system RatA family toxin [Alphaproteobacteria bacterium]
MPEHSDRRILPFTSTQMFDLVADIERYPEFLPWCLNARINSKKKNIVSADLIIGYRGLREKFTSIVEMKKPELISVSYGGGALKRLKNEWRFTSTKTGGCEVEFYVDFALRSTLLGALMEVFFNKAFNKMVSAFEKRAEALYKKT